MISILLLIIFQSGWATTFSVENEVYVLTDENFQDFLSVNPKAMVFFYTTPGCSPCEQFIPQFEKAAVILKDENILFGKLEAEANKNSALLYGVNGYPSVILYDDSENKTRYSGGRTYDAIQLWIYEQINPGTMELKDMKHIKQELSSHQCVFIFFGEDPKDRTFRRFRDYSYSNANTIFRHTFIQGAAKELGLPEKTLIAVYRKFDKSPVVFSPKQLKVNDLIVFTEINMLPRITEWTAELEFRVTKKDRQALILFTNGDKTAEQAFKEFAQGKLPEEYLIFVQNTPKSLSRQNLTEKFGVFESQIQDGPKLLMLLKNATQRYLFQQEFTPQNIENFFQDCLVGKAHQYYRSQQKAVYIENSAGLTILTGQTYNQEMLQSDSDWVVIYIDQTKESHLEVLQVISRVAIKLASNKNVKFAVTDAVSNEFPDFKDLLDVIKIRIYKGPGGKKQFMKFTIKSNKIQEDRLINFVYDNTSFEWVGVKEEL